MSGPHGRLRLAVLAGFLGAGKSTWLRHALHQGGFGGALVLVNEAASASVDDVLLGRATGLEVLDGGCACCAGRGALVASLRRICDRRLRGAPIARLVLETSGLADPAAITQAIAEDPVLQHHILVEETIVIVDALHGLAQLREEPLSRRQIAAADRIVVSKLDGAGRPAVARLVATLCATNPAARLAGSIMGSEVPLPESPGVAPEVWVDEARSSEAGAPASPGEPRPPPIAEALDPGGPDSWPALSLWLSALIHARGDDIVRIKGVVRTPRGPLLLQSVRKVVQAPEILPEGPQTEQARLVVIGRGFTRAQLLRSLQRFAGG